MDVQILDNDFHNLWGCNMIKDLRSSAPDSHKLWMRFIESRADLDRNYFALLHQYRDKFRDFFGGAMPYSYHAHGGDLAVPATVGSLLLDLVKKGEKMESLEHVSQTRAKGFDFLGWTDQHIYSPKFATVAKTYGAGYGASAFIHSNFDFMSNACGAKPYPIHLTDRALSDVISQVQEAKSRGCIATVVEMVSSKGGEILPPEELANLSTACRIAAMPLIIDECLTAIRCGAPFVYLRPEYSHIEKPDLVFFGKAVGTNGIAVNFDGPVISKLGYDDVRSQNVAVRYWQNLVSRPISMAELIEAHSILEAADREDWPSRAAKIGILIRGIIEEAERHREVRGAQYDKEPIAGLDALICLKKHRACHFPVMGAATNEVWVRWLPSLDARMTDKRFLQGALGVTDEVPDRKALVEQLSEQGLHPGWCWSCGDQAVGSGWCRTCCLATCDREYCEKRLASHTCRASNSHTSTTDLGRVDFDAKDGDRVIQVSSIA